MKYLKHSELKSFREKRLKENNYICPICKRKITLENSVVDHIHSQHKSIYPDTNKLIRDVICSDCNVLLGKLENQYLRSSKEYKEQVSLIDFLEGVIIYINKHSRLENFLEPLIHPIEWKQPIIKKSNFNKFKKLVKEKLNKNIEYPKSGKVTRELEKLAKKLDWDFEFYEI